MPKGFEYKKNIKNIEKTKNKKNGIIMQPPRMTFTLSGDPGNTNNICVANALKYQTPT